MGSLTGSAVQVGLSASVALAGVEYAECAGLTGFVGEVFEIEAQVLVWGRGVEGVGLGFICLGLRSRVRG